MATAEFSKFAGILSPAVSPTFKYKNDLLSSAMGFPNGAVLKNPPANAGDTRDVGSVSGSGRSLEGGNVNPLQYSCLGNPIDRGAWRATVHGVTESDTTEHPHKLFGKFISHIYM